jgi:colanic acid/amylovoran biosynthesis glycosyltransferase
MRILHYVELYPVRSETFIKNLITQIGKKGINNSLIIHYATKEISESNIDYQLIAYRRNIQHFFRNRLFRYRKINNHKFLSEIKNVNPDIIHAHFGPNGIRMYQYLKKKNISTPLIISLHGTDLININENKILKRILRGILKNNRVFIIVPSKFLFESVLSLGGAPERIHIIPSAVNKMFENNRVERAPNEFRITNIGRFIPIKGQLNLIEAFFQVSEKYPKIKMKLVGYGQLESVLKEQVTRLGISNQVEIICSADQNQVREILNETDLYIQPSILGSSGEQEALGLSVLEAQMSGCPCIVSKIGGLPETIENNLTGTLVEPASVQELTSAIIRYIEDESLWISHATNSKLNAMQKFREFKVYQQVIDLYADIIRTP